VSERYRETGQINYEAYSWFMAARHPEMHWDDWGRLSEEEKDAWRAAAHETFRKGWSEADARRPRREI
jgi:hypothetical protein